MGTANMYGQNYNICLDGNEDERCAGGDNEADHYFYFTDIVSSSSSSSFLLFCFSDTMRQGTDSLCDSL